MRAGIDLGGTKIQAVVIDDDGASWVRSGCPLPSGGPADVADAMAQAVRTAAGQVGIETGELRGVGVGSPGVINARRGLVSSARNLPDWRAPSGSAMLSRTRSAPR